MKPRWAVISEHGCEGSGLTYDEAHTLLLHLGNERFHGLCIVTDEAARHFLREGSTAPQLKRPAATRDRT